MRKRLLIVEDTFRLKMARRREGLLLAPLLPAAFFAQLKKPSFTGWLIFADGREQEVHGRFFQSHFSGRPPVQPGWVTECLIEDVETIPAGTELWWDELE